VKAYRDHGNIRKAAAVLGITHQGLHYQLKRAAQLGMFLNEGPAMPGFLITETSETIGADGTLKSRTVRQAPDEGLAEFQMPEGHRVKGVSSLVGPNNEIRAQWIKTREDNQPDWPAVFKAAFSEYEGKAEAKPGPEVPAIDLLNLIPCNDWHINMLCWSREVGQSWDLKIAERVIGAAITSVISRSPKAETAIILSGGDLLHADDNTNRTAKSGNVLDADGRHAKGLEAAQRLKVLTIDSALEHNNKVIVRVLKGNHDEYSSVAIAYFLSAWYRNEPRVTVDLDQSLFWFYRHGRVMLGATHGHAAKLKDMPGIMAHRRAEDWGKSTFRYAHGFHVHHREKTATEGNGVICEAHQAPIPQDAWHYGEGYLSGRSVMSITYHRNYGERGRVIEGIA
jgi:hypothetical protein